MTSRLPWDAWALAVVLSGAAGGVWLWDRALVARTAPVVTDASPREIRERLPIPSAFQLPDEEGSVLLRAAAETNPFSSKRGEPPPASPAAGGGGSTVQAAPPAPIFVFKGIVAMGAIRRAIVEDAASKKTYFLQVGQEVAGFKVLDIDESQVLLSDLNTQKQMAVSRSPATGP